MCVLWTVSSYMTWQIIPPLQHTETGNWPSDETWCISWLVHSRLASVQAGREICPSEMHSLTCSILYKNIRPYKSVCFVYRGKEKKLHPEGVNRQHINASSVTFHCAVWGVFWNTTSSEKWRCKIRRVGYYMHKFIKNKIKKRVIIAFFNLLWFFFFWRGDPLLVQ